MKKRPARNTTCTRLLALALSLFPALPVVAQEAAPDRARIAALAQAMEEQDIWGETIQEVTVSGSDVVLVAQMSSFRTWSEIVSGEHRAASNLAVMSACDTDLVLDLLTVGATITLHLLDDTGTLLDTRALGDCPQTDGQIVARRFTAFMQQYLGQTIDGFAHIHAIDRSTSETRLAVELVHPEVPADPRNAERAMRVALGRAAMAYFCDFNGMEAYFSFGASLILRLTTDDAPNDAYTTVRVRDCDGDHRILSSEPPAASGDDAP